MKIKLLFIGRPSKYKGFHVLEKALSFINKDFWQLTVIGDFNNKNNAYSKNIFYLSFIYS